MSVTPALFVRAPRLRCPACGGGPVFVSWLRMCPSCPSCGLRFDREPEGGYWVGSNTINLFAAEGAYAVFLIGVGAATWPNPPWNLLLWGGMGLMLIFPVFFFPWSKTLFIAVDLTFRPPEAGDYEQPREAAHRPTGRRG